MKPQKPAASDTREITMRNLGIIAERALHYWQRLPASVKIFYEADDMISDVVLHVYRKARLYDADRAKPSTFVYNVASRRCQDILAHYWAPKRGAAVTVPLEESWAAEAAEKALIADYVAANRNDELNSRDVIEHIIQRSPDFVRRFLAELFSPGGVQKLPPQETLDALRKVIRQESATRQDFDTVLRCFVAT